MCLCTNFALAQDNSTDDHLTNLTYTVEESYKWSAPSDFVFTTNVDAEIKTGTVSVMENIIAGGSTLKISIGPDEVFKLTSGEGSTRDYKLLKDSNELSAGSEVLAVPSGVNEATQNLNFELQGVVNGNTSQVAGTYTGTLNFVANIETTSSTVSVAKGDIVTMSQLGLTDVDANADSTADTFRVLSVDGTNVKLLAMDSYKSAYFGSNNIYSGSILDTEMTKYYDTLPANVQNAIVAQDINQLTYSKSSSSSESNVLHIADLYSDDYYYTNTKTVNVGNRSVFALGIQDIIDYLGSDITGAQLNEMFFNSSTSVSRVWLRSANAAGTGTNYTWYVRGLDGFVAGDDVSSIQPEVRPAFVINLG